MSKLHSRILPVMVCAALMLGGCAHSEPETPDGGYTGVTPLEVVELNDEAVALSGAPAAALSQLLEPKASGLLVKENSRAVIDYSNTAEGYVMVRFKQPSTLRLKAQVKGPTTTYTYNVTPEQWETFPLSDGNGSYKITVYENTGGNKYASVVSQTMEVTLKDEFVPFLSSNQYVNYAHAVQTLDKARELMEGVEQPLEKVARVYDYVVGTMTYDLELAATVQSGYLPVLDRVLEVKKGICFDYAALMSGMLRSQGVPCKLVVGYAGTEYHAWISVYSEESGWIEGAVFFDGTCWKRLDPTFASNGQGDESIMEFIREDSNYIVKYLY